MTKFERDKVYKTLDGREAFLGCINAPGERPILAVVKDADGWRVHSYLPNGQMWCDGRRDPIDLMLPKPEPVVEWGWVARNGFMPEPDKERAVLATTSYPDYRRLAKRVTTFED